MLRIASNLERIARKEEARNTPFDNSFCGILCYSNIVGIEQIPYKRVLEIGPRDPETFEGCFVGAEYEAVGFDVLDDPSKGMFRGNFMHLKRPSYGLIISCGIFEVGALDREGLTPRRFEKSENPARLKKLYDLTKPGGYNIIGTVSEPCIFSDDEITRAGFSQCFRKNQFYGTEKRRFEGYFKSELIVFRRPL